MARIATASPVASPSDQLDAELGQLLKRMQHSILYVDADREHALRTSEIEREKAERVSPSIAVLDTAGRCADG